MERIKIAYLIYRHGSTAREVAPSSNEQLDKLHLIRHGYPTMRSDGLENPTHTKKLMSLLRTQHAISTRLCLPEPMLLSYSIRIELWVSRHPVPLPTCSLLIVTPSNGYRGIKRDMR